MEVLEKNLGGPNSRVNAVERVTAKTFFERLYLVSGLRQFTPFLAMPLAPTPPHLNLQLFLDFGTFKKNCQCDSPSNLAKSGVLGLPIRDCAASSIILPQSDPSWARWMWLRRQSLSVCIWFHWQDFRQFLPRVNCPCAPTPFPAISRLPCNYFKWSLNFFGSAIRQVIWPSPGALPVPSLENLCSGRGYSWS